MANEKRVSISFSVLKNGLEARVNWSKTADLSGQNYQATVQNIPTSWTALTFDAGLGSVERLALVNTDSTNFVEIALANDNSGKFAKILAGEAIYFMPSTSTLYAKADTAAIELQKVACEP